MTKQKIGAVLVADADDKQIRVASAYALTVITGPIGKAKSNADALREVAEVHYDAIILGLDMDSKRHAVGLRLMRAMHLLQPDLKILVMHENFTLSAFRAALSCGASALISRNTGLRDIPHALDAVLNGKRYICSGSHREAATLPMQALSPREQLVIERLVRGQTLSEIASDLGRSLNTISSHKESAIRKLNIADAQDLEQFLFDLSPLISTQTLAS